MGWGEVMNGGFGLLLDGTADADRKLRSMLHFDVNNGIARRSWARNGGAVLTAQRALDENEDLVITMPYLADDKLLDKIL